MSYRLAAKAISLTVHQSVVSKIDRLSGLFILFIIIMIIIIIITRTLAYARLSLICVNAKNPREVRTAECFVGTEIKQSVTGNNLPKPVSIAIILECYFFEHTAVAYGIMA